MIYVSRILFFVAVAASIHIRWLMAEATAFPNVAYYPPEVSANAPENIFAEVAPGDAYLFINEIQYGTVSWGL